MFFKKEIITEGRIVLLDENLSLQKWEAVQALETVDDNEVVLVENNELASILEELLDGIVDPADTLLVFPGNGANFPRKLSRICSKAICVSVHAKRFWQPGRDPVVETGLIYPERFILPEVKRIVVIDDVISSGLTMRKLFQKNAWRFPIAKWTACSWMSQTLPSSSIKGYDEVHTACLVKKTGKGKVPINSLSTLRQNLEIATGYARRHFKEPEVFLHLIQK